MRRGVMAVLTALILSGSLSGCVGRGQEEHGTALHHLGGPGDGVGIPAGLEPDDPSSPPVSPVVSASTVPAAPLPASASPASPAAPRPAAPARRTATGAASVPSAASGSLPPAPPAPPGPEMEEVIITPLDISGYWKITARSTFGLGDAEFYKRYDKDTHICRFEQRLTRIRAYCPLLDAVGTGEIIDHTLDLSWDLVSGISFHLHGQVDDDRSFVGEADGRLIGLVGITAHVPASGHRFDPPDAAPAPASMAAMRQALRDWDARTVTDSLYTPNIVGRLRKLTAQARGAERGDLLSLRYLGSIDRALNKKNAPDARVTHDVYEARYARGAWLCLIHVGDDGRISDFAC